jgi:biotin/methionine sulfoxide reductase
MEWLRYLYDRARQQAAQRHVDLPSFEAFWETGHVELPVPHDPPVLFATYRADSQANPLKTPSGHIELFSDTIAAFGYDDCPGHPVWLEPAEWLGSEKAQVYPHRRASRLRRRSRLSYPGSGDLWVPLA